MSVKIIYITIKNSGVIPFLNRRGPISSPIAIAERVALNLKSMGYAITIHEKDVVSVNLETGIREFISSKDASTNVVTQGHPPEDALTPNSPVDVLNVEVPKEVITEPVSTTEEEIVQEEVPKEETPVATPENEETEEETQVEVYSKEHYASWTKPQLVTYLRKLDDYLPDDVIAKIASSNKTQLLAIIDEYLINADDE